MPDQPLKPAGYLPRLTPEFYRGDATVFWTHIIKDRAQGWLTPVFHAAFRELMLHAAARETLLCPVYVLMPDHLHFIWMGLAADSDQRRATAFLRLRLKHLLAPHALQHQAHDHVLRDDERKRGAFAATCLYIADNPARAGLTPDEKPWSFRGCIVPGYPDLDPHASDYWEHFWRIHRAFKERGRLGKINAAP